MKRLDKFLLKSFIGPFVAILLIVVFVLMMQFLWLYVDELVGKGLSFGVIAEFLMWGSCTILPLALPLATLLSAMMIMGQLAENFELTAMKSAGISMLRIMTPIMVATCFICVGALFTADDLVPHAYQKIYSLRDDISRTKKEIKIPDGTFYDGIEGYILRVEKTDEETGTLHKVIIYDHTNGRGNTSVTIADSAYLKIADSKDHLNFTLFNGTNYTENNNWNFRDTSLSLQRISFKRQDLNISLKNYVFEKSDDDRFADQISSQSLASLRVSQDSLHNIQDDTHRQQFRKFSRTHELMKHRQFDSLYTSRERKTFEADGFCEWGDEKLDAEISACESAVLKSNEMVSDLLNFNRESYEYMFYLRRTDLEILKRFAGALACFIMFFIGAPLGALIRKGGLGTPAIVSVLFFVVYWVVDISGTKLARDGAVSAISGAFISAYVLAPIGAFLTYMAAKDTTFGGSDSLKILFRRLWSRIKGIFHKTRIVYMGTPDFAVEPLDTLRRNKYKIVGVVTVADKPSGRGLKVNESAVKKYAVQHGIPVLQPLKLKDPEFLEALKAWKADLFVVVAFRVLPEEVWSMPKLGTFNLHAALLPQYRGAAPINWAVINGERQTGVTTFLIDKDIDTGGIILRQEHTIAPTDTAGDVHDALMHIGSKLVLETVQGLIEKNVETRVQKSFIQGDEVLKPAPKITRETCRIDWNDSAGNIYNRIRGLSPYPTAFTELSRNGEKAQQLKIFFGEVCDLHAEPGTVISDGKTYFAIAARDGAIRITDLQLEGKKRMDVRSFLLGMRNTEELKAIV